MRDGSYGHHTLKTCRMANHHFQTLRGSAYPMTCIVTRQVERISWVVVKSCIVEWSS